MSQSQTIEAIDDEVVLLDEAGSPIGRALKSAAHGPDTALHLAFSCHVVNALGEVLVTRRALTKQAWPGVWTNSFCGHPAPGESLDDAVGSESLRRFPFSPGSRVSAGAGSRRGLAVCGGETGSGL